MLMKSFIILLVPIISKVIEEGATDATCPENGSQSHHFVTVEWLNLSPIPSPAPQPVLLKVDNLDHIDQTIELLENLFKNSLFSIDNYGHPGNGWVVSFCHSQTGDIVASAGEQPRDPKELHCYQLIQKCMYTHHPSRISSRVCPPEPLETHSPWRNYKFH